MGVSTYRRIADEIAARIAAGDLKPGDPVPSTRQIVATHGVAMATATRVITALRQQGLVEAKPGVGTVVTRTSGPREPTPDRAMVVRTAITIADAEGLTGLSMRRLAGALGIPTMSLYRHVKDKEDLILLMMDEVMGANPPPSDLDPDTDHWRACVEAVARLQWSMYQRHTWLAQAISFTRPLLAPNAMAHTEWVMRALDRFDLGSDLQFRAAVVVANYVRGTAVNLADEAQAEQETGMTDEQWIQSQQERFAAVMATGKLPMMAKFAAGNPEFSLDLLLECGLQAILDGLEKQLGTTPSHDTIQR
jgi:DNA-binding transcriptional regulator YhcF (GntR family)